MCVWASLKRKLNSDFMNPSVIWAKLGNYRLQVVAGSIRKLLTSFKFDLNCVKMNYERSFRDDFREGRMDI